MIIEIVPVDPPPIAMANHCMWYCAICTKRQNELFSEVWKLFYQGCTDVPAQLPSAMLPRQARGTCKKTVIQTSETVHFVSWYITKVFLVYITHF